jgi:predicted lysophospholipase L1 biosynthesis ABC-type transport system permease subunit
VGASCTRFLHHQIDGPRLFGGGIDIVSHFVPVFIHLAYSMARGGVLRLRACLVVALAAWACSTADAALSPRAHIGMQTSGRQLLQGKKSTNCSSAPCFPAA